MNDETRRQAPVEWQNAYVRPVLLVVAILVVVVVWAVGGISSRQWHAVPTLIFVGAAPPAGLMGGTCKADR